MQLFCIAQTVHSQQILEADLISRPLSTLPVTSCQPADFLLISETNMCNYPYKSAIKLLFSAITRFFSAISSDHSTARILVKNFTISAIILAIFSVTLQFSA